MVGFTANSPELETTLTGSSPQEDFGTIRQKLVKLCAGGNFIDALIYLEESGLDAEHAPSLWEYLERQLSNAREHGLAEAVRRRLSQFGGYSTQMALTDAEAALTRGHARQAELILRSTFAPGTHPPVITNIMARALSMDNSQADEARALFSTLAASDGDAALAEIDLLRAQDQLFAAEMRCAEHAERFPHDYRFPVRLARIKGALSKWNEAIALWETLTDWPGFPRAEALANRIRLIARYDDGKGIEALLAEFLLASPDLPLLLSVTEATGLTNLSDAALERAARRQRREPLLERAWDEVSQTLLKSGQLGRVAWLANLSLPIGDTAREALASARRILGNRLESITSIPQAERLTSPDCLLPYPPFIRNRRTPGRMKRRDARLLLVNASLVSGGAERQFVALVDALLAQGIEPDQMDLALFSLAPDRGRSHFLAELQRGGVRVHDLSTVAPHYQRMEQYLEDRCQLLPNPMRGDVVALHHVIRQVRPNVIHGWQDRGSLAAGFIGAFTGIERIVMSARNMQPRKREPGLRIDGRGQYAALCALPNVCLTANSVAGCLDYEDWLDLSPGSVKLLNNGLDVGRFRTAARNKTARRLQSGAKVTITGVFRLAANKRPFLWLETVAALKRMSDYQIQPRIVGAGPMLADTKAKAAELGLEDLQIEGDLVHPSDIYGTADVVLLMSRIEGTPNALLEAQALGLAVAACDVGGVRGAILAEGKASGLVLPEQVSPQDAATRLNEWLPGALSAVPDPRQKFIDTQFSLETLGTRTVELYGID